jgi:dihydrolipoamide dehydrogenase
VKEANRATRVAVVGAGPGGYPAAFLAADLGMQVMLVDSADAPGGVCLHRGCIPSKALLHVARLLGEAREAAEWGVKLPEPEIDLERLRSWKDAVVGRLTGGLEQMSRRRRIQYVQGRARFTGANTLVLENAGEPEQVHRFDYAVVATGSRPALLPDLPAGNPRIMDSTAALKIPDVPATLLVVGGGYIGLELGIVYAALGSKVTLVEVTAGLLPGVDRDLVDVLARRVRKEFHEILLNTKVSQMIETKQGIRVKLVGLDLAEPERTFEKVLVAVGRRPNSDDLGLETTRVELDARGFIKTDEQRRTGEPSIFAIGDVAGEPMLAHKATHEAKVAVEAIAGKPAVFDAAAIPAVVFTDPEIAWCGLTETQALIEKRAFTVSRFPWAASGRASTLGRSDGLTKLVLEPRTERVLGVGIVGPGAGELIGEGALAVEMGARASDLQHTIHAHPTLSETVMEAAEVFFGHSPHWVAG